MTRYSYQTVYVDRYISGDEIRPFEKSKSDAVENPDWTTLQNGSYLAPEGARVVSMQVVERESVWMSRWIPSQAMMIVLEREHSPSPYRG